MQDNFSPVARQSLPDKLARQIRDAIQAGAYKEGDRLPSIGELAQTFGVAPPTVREALTRLETLGLVEVRHGVGVYVGNTVLAELLEAVRAMLQAAAPAPPPARPAPVVTV